MTLRTHVACRRPPWKPVRPLSGRQSKSRRHRLKVGKGETCTDLAHENLLVRLTRGVGCRLALGKRKERRSAGADVLFHRNDRPANGQVTPLIAAFSLVGSRLLGLAA